MAVVPSGDLAVVHGLPDTEENALVTAITLAERRAGPVVLLCQDEATARASLAMVGAALGADHGRVQLLPKRSLRGLFAALRAELLFHTHGLYDSPGSVGRRLHVNLWHGTGPKRSTNAVYSQRTRADALASCTPVWGRQTLDALRSGARARLLTGNPRQDLLHRPASPDALRRLGVDPARPLVLWLPTYRVSGAVTSAGTLRDGRAFGDAAADLDLVGLAPGLARRHGVQLLAKAHHFDADHLSRLGVPVLHDREIWAAGATLYQLLGATAGMLSDYSSVWVDYLELDRPIGLLCPDLADYAAGRGLKTPDLREVAGPLILRRAADLEDFFAAVGAGRAFRPRSNAAARARLSYRIQSRRRDRLLDEVRQMGLAIHGWPFGLSRQPSPVGDGQ